MLGAVQWALSKLRARIAVRLQLSTVDDGSTYLSWCLSRASIPRYASSLVAARGLTVRLGSVLRRARESEQSRGQIIMHYAIQPYAAGLR
jgi:hypothetical protein